MRFILGFIFTAMLMTLIVWVGGYDFDKRSVDAAFGLGMCLVISFMGGVLSESTKY